MQGHQKHLVTLHISIKKHKKHFQFRAHMGLIFQKNSDIIKEKGGVKAWITLNISKKYMMMKK